MTENWYPEADPNRDRSMPLWPELPMLPAASAPSDAVAAPAAPGSPGRTGGPGMGRPWAQRLATAAAAVVLSLGGGAVVGAAALRLETDTVAVAGLAPDAAAGWSGAAAWSGAAVGWSGAASIAVVRFRGEDAAAGVV